MGAAGVTGVDEDSQHEEEPGVSLLPAESPPEPFQPVEQQSAIRFGGMGFLRGSSAGCAAAPNETVGPASESNWWPHTAKAEVDRLEEALTREVQRCAMKDQESEQMRTLLLKLEDLVQRQETARQEEDRLSSIELTLGQQQTDTEEKVAKLLLAAAGEKRRAEAAEQSRDEVQRANEATLKQLQAMLETEQAACQQLRSRVGELEDGLKLPQFVEQCSQSLPSCPEEVGTEGVAHTGISGAHDESAAIKELEQQLYDERALHYQLNAKLVEKDLQLQKQWKLESPTNSSLSEHEVRHNMGQPSKQEVETEVALRHLTVADVQPLDGGREFSDKDHTIQQLQHQLADEVALRLNALGHVAELGRQLSKVEHASETKDVSQQQFLQNRLILKDREVCKLQDQIVEELAKLQKMQYSVIKKEQTIADLQQRLQGASSITQSLTLPELPQLPVRGEAEPDVAVSVNVQVVPKTRNSCSGFSGPVPLGWRPPLVSGSQAPCTQAMTDSYVGATPPAVGTEQRTSGTVRRGIYIQQQGSSITDGCVMTARAATFHCSTCHEFSCNLGAAPALHGSLMAGGTFTGNHRGDSQGGFDNSKRLPSSFSEVQA